MNNIIKEAQHSVKYRKFQHIQSFDKGFQFYFPDKNPPTNIPLTFEQVQKEGTLFDDLFSVKCEISFNREMIDWLGTCTDLTYIKIMEEIIVQLLMKNIFWKMNTIQMNNKSIPQNFMLWNEYIMNEFDENTFYTLCNSISGMALFIKRKLEFYYTCMRDL